jgi:hypothetical protein
MGRDKKKPEPVSAKTQTDKSKEKPSEPVDTFRNPDGVGEEGKGSQTKGSGNRDHFEGRSGVWETSDQTR